jgi:predicted dehydrogenase
MDMIDVAIVGTGGISGHHLRGYRQFGDRCRIVGLCDIKPEKAEKRRVEFELGEIPVFDDHRDLLREVKADLVSVCTPPSTHAEITINALKAGCGVLCEKPMASSLEECDAMRVAEKQSGQLLSVISQNRFTPGFWKLKQVVASGKAGPVKHFHVDSQWWRGHNYYDLWWRGTWEQEGGGCTLNHAVHHIDIAKWIAGMPRRVKAAMTNVAHDNSEVEDLSIAILMYDNGSLGEITSSVVHHGQKQSIRFQCEKAMVSSPWSVDAQMAKGNGFPDANEALEEELTAFHEAAEAPEHTGHVAQIEDVLTALEQGRPPLVDSEAGRNTLEVITAIYAAAITDKTIELPIGPDSPFYRTEGLLELAPRFYEKAHGVGDFADASIEVGGDEKSGS